jgi:dihydrofolate synthase/folylpolyglutamate synthase
MHQLNQLGLRVEKEHIRTGLSQVKKLTGLHGRWEQIAHDPAVVLDVAHNVDGVKQVLSQLSLSHYEHLHIVIGMVKDKEVEEVLALLPKEATYYFTQAQIARALDAGSLKEKAQSAGLNGDTYPDVNSALNQARSKACEKDLVLVCGSVFLVGEVTRH